MNTDIRNIKMVVVVGGETVLSRIFEIQHFPLHSKEDVRMQNYEAEILITLPVRNEGL
jgi:hypothetical protein